MTAADIRGASLGFIVLGILAFFFPAFGLVWGIILMGGGILGLLLSLIPWGSGESAVVIRRPRAGDWVYPTEPNRNRSAPSDNHNYWEVPESTSTSNGVGMFNGSGAWLKARGWMIGGFVFIGIAVCTMIFGFGPDNRSNHLIATAILLVASVACFMVEAGVFGDYLKAFLLGLWLLASFLAGYLVVKAANMEGWTLFYGACLFLCFFSAIMAICAMIGHLRVAMEALGKGIGWLFATFFKALFNFKEQPVLAFFLWFAISGSLFLLALAIGNSDFLFDLNVEPEVLTKFAWGFGFAAFVSAIGFFVSLVSLMRVRTVRT